MNEEEKKESENLNEKSQTKQFLISSKSKTNVSKGSNNQTKINIVSNLNKSSQINYPRRISQPFFNS